MTRGTLFIMVKEPRPGRVKTRLGRDIGMTAAAWWFRHQTRALIRRLRDPRWQIVLCVSPDREGVQSRVWPADIGRLAQGGGDLGARMARMLATTHAPAVLIGGDIPGITRHHIARAFKRLGPHASVIGPAPDGGFWLVGLAQPARQPRTLFQNVRWSHSETLKDTLPTLPQPVALIDTLDDVDTKADLLRSKNTQS